MAYLGDAVFELYVREKILTTDKGPVDASFQRAKAFVSATAQAKMYFKIYDSLDDNEQAVIRRGRNAKAYSRAKNASVADYRHATGLEALIGYLYLKGNKTRLDEILSMCITEDGNDG